MPIAFVRFGLVAVFAHAAGVAGAQPYYWTDGQKQYPLYLVPGQVVDFSQAPSRPRAVNASQFSRALGQGKPQPFSPAFADTPGGRVSRALAGGVIVTFATGTPAEVVQSWARAQGVRLGKRLVSVPGTPLRWFVPGPIGLASLELSNRLATSRGPEHVEPHWWLYLQPKTAFSVPPGTSEQLRAARRRVSDAGRARTLQTAAPKGKNPNEK